MFFVFLLVRGKYLFFVSFGPPLGHLFVNTFLLIKQIK